MSKRAGKGSCFGRTRTTSETIIPIFETDALGATRRGIEHALPSLAAADHAVDALGIWDDMRSSIGSDDELRSCPADLGSWTADRLSESGRQRGTAPLRRAAAAAALDRVVRATLE